MQIEGNAADPEVKHVATVTGGPFAIAIDRQAREQSRSIEERHASRQEGAPVLPGELHALLEKMKSCELPKPIASKAVAYTRTCWEKLTRFMEHPIIDLSTNWVENAMRGIAPGRKNWMQVGGKEAGPKIAAPFFIVQSCRKLAVPIRKYLGHVLPD